MGIFDRADDAPEKVIEYLHNARYADPSHVEVAMASRLALKEAMRAWVAEVCMPCTLALVSRADPSHVRT
jgi:hypothetical protein